LYLSLIISLSALQSNWLYFFLSYCEVSTNKSHNWYHITQKWHQKWEKVWKICFFCLEINSFQIIVDKATKYKLPKWIVLHDKKQILHLWSYLTVFSFLPIKPDCLVVSISDIFLRGNSIKWRKINPEHLAFIKLN
jgi:hypothetical protein